MSACSIGFANSILTISIPKAESAPTFLRFFLFTKASSPNFSPTRSPGDVSRLDKDVSVRRAWPGLRRDLCFIEPHSRGTKRIPRPGHLTRHCPHMDSSLLTRHNRSRTYTPIYVLPLFEEGQ